MITTFDGKPLFEQIATATENDAASFAGLSLFPLYFVSENQPAAGYFRLRSDALVNAPPSLKRAPGRPYARSVAPLDSDAYACEHYGHEEPVTPEENAKYGAPGQAQSAAMRRAHNIILLGHEIRTADMANSAAVPNAAVAVPWDDPNGDPVTDVATARQKIFYSCAREANVMTCGREVYEVLKRWARAAGLIKISDKDARWPDLLAALFDVERLVVARALVNVANEEQEIDLGQIWGDTVMLAHVDFTRDFKAPSFGRTFCADKETPYGVTLFGYDQETIKSGIVRGEQTVAEKLANPNCGFRLQGTLTR